MGGRVINIFVTSYDPAICAKHLDDDRLSQMALVTAQLLSNAMIIGPLKQVNPDHPVSLWVKESPGNFRWTLAHFVSILNEHHERFKEEHMMDQYVPAFAEYATTLEDGDMTPFVNCTPFKETQDVRQAYRAALQEKWGDQAKPPRRRGRSFNWGAWYD